MAISFDNALGIHEQALVARSQRAEVLANNLANADTPGFKARDVDFQAMLDKATEASQGMSMERTHQSHMDVSAGAGSSNELLYRLPHQPSIDGNTVDAQQEQTRFMRNAMDFQASFQFLNSKFSGLSKAITGQ
ncbi:flagellar basal body rod protein FlgB [Marinobacter zhanjiangensis]|uniref:Flagellar basal body rod protein FlgB n=1 Tax=Marinobacter zhanjiangensis TaxID=578215 RepID=A0ABQ3ASE4_9GAMM|nr:flagellar basal body rod protein FlgB [Marinobacter zhanjiangensis]GGY66323.1 flagellar basal body rod protein FlgB [Marinobacter zhanjiangensis]